MYINTFCLAYHLTAAIAGMAVKPEGWGNWILRNDWWQGRPQFNYRTDIEIFVAVEATWQTLISEGHDLDKTTDVLEFTRYDIGNVFLRKMPSNSVVGSSKGSSILVTDVRTTAEFYLSSMKKSPAAWPLPSSDLKNIQIHNAWERNLPDLFATNGKLYVFGAPMTHILSSNEDKYTPRETGVDAIPTYYVFRCNAPKSASTLRVIRDAIAEYYYFILDLNDPNGFIDDSVADAYARMAMTTGEANPFFDLSLGHSMSGLYRDILQRHHAPKPASTL
jgi:hypothetical protein